MRRASRRGARGSRSSASTALGVASSSSSVSVSSVSPSVRRRGGRESGVGSGLDMANEENTEKGVETRNGIPQNSPAGGGTDERSEGVFNPTHRCSTAALIPPANDSLPSSTAERNGVLEGQNTGEEKPKEEQQKEDGLKVSSTSSGFLHEEAEDEYEVLCGICFTQVDNVMNPRGILNSCAHLFCAYCIREWGAQTNICPSCKLRFTRIVIPAGPNRPEEIAKVRRKNYANWDADDESENNEEAESDGEDRACTHRCITNLCCSICELSENPLRMIFCDRRDCSFIAHLECLKLNARPLTFLCASCKEEAEDGERTEGQEEGGVPTVEHTTGAPPSATDGGRYTRTSSSQVTPRGTAWSGNTTTPTRNRRASSSTRSQRSAASVEPRLRPVNVQGERVWTLTSSSSSSSLSTAPLVSRTVQERERVPSSVAPVAVRSSTPASLSRRTANPPPRLPLPSPRVEHSHRRLRDDDEERGERIPRPSSTTRRRTEDRSVMPFSNPSAMVRAPFSRPGALYSGGTNEEDESFAEVGEAEGEEGDPLYFLKPSSHTLQARGALCGWKSEHPEGFPSRTIAPSPFVTSPSLPFPFSSPLRSSPVARTTAVPLSFSFTRDTSSLAVTSPPPVSPTSSVGESSLTVEPTSSFVVPKHIPAPFQRSLTRLASSSFVSSTSSSSITPRRGGELMEGRVASPSPHLSTALPRSRESADLEDPHRRALLVERLTKEWAADMIDVLRQRRRTDYNARLCMEYGPAITPFYPTTPAEEEALLWREAMNACRPQAEEKIRQERIQLRAQKERALRIEAQRETLALEKLARLIASHHEKMRRREGGGESTSALPSPSTPKPAGSPITTVVINVDEEEDKR